MRRFFYKQYRFSRVLPSRCLPNAENLLYSLNTPTTMATQKAGTLITTTIETLDNGIENAKLKDGASLITEWLFLVKKGEATRSIADDLQELHNQLGEKEPDKKRLAQLVKKLGDETAKAARQADDTLQGSLKDLGESLKDFAKELK